MSSARPGDFGTDTICERIEVVPDGGDIADFVVEFFGDVVRVLEVDGV